MSKFAIRAENLSKQFRLGQRETYKTLRDTLTDAFMAPFRRGLRPPEPKSIETIWALKDVSFEVQPGEVVGIIGRNGAGKSTLLKILSRITEPTQGNAWIRGRVRALLEVGTGFNHELTGRENIYLNGAILGMTRKEIDRKFDDIVAFAELDQFMDTPVKRYSSGMFMRLAFSVAAHLEPEILIVDEVLAVGDIRFQRKCMDKMGEVSQEGRTVLFVSHNMPAVARLCPRVILLTDGELSKDGPADEVIGNYLQTGLGLTANLSWPDLESSPGDSIVRLRSVRVLNKDSRSSEVLRLTEPIGIEIVYDVLENDKVLVPLCQISNTENVIIFQTGDWNPAPRRAGRYTNTIWIPANLLAEGMFFVSTSIMTPYIKTQHVKKRELLAFQVVEDLNSGPMRAMWGGKYPGVVRPELPWQVEGPQSFS